MFIYHYLFTLVLKSPDGEWPITYTFTFTFTVATEFSTATFNQHKDLHNQGLNEPQLFQQLTLSPLQSQSQIIFTQQILLFQNCSQQNIWLNACLHKPISMCLYYILLVVIQK